MHFDDSAALEGATLVASVSNYGSLPKEYAGLSVVAVFKSHFEVKAKTVGPSRSVERRNVADA